MKKRNERGRMATSYIHPMGRRCDDILLYHTMGRGDLIAELARRSPTYGGPGSIIASYGGIEEYEKAMAAVYRNVRHTNIWAKDNLGGTRVTTKGGRVKMRQNYDIVIEKPMFRRNWIPVFWYRTADCDTSEDLFMKNMLCRLGLEELDSGVICMYSRERRDTVIYMRKDFLEYHDWGRTQIAMWNLLTNDYIKEHGL